MNRIKSILIALVMAVLCMQSVKADRLFDYPIQGTWENISSVYFSQQSLQLGLAALIDDPATKDILNCVSDLQEVELVSTVDSRPGRINLMNFCRPILKKLKMQLLFNSMVNNKTINIYVGSIENNNAVDLLIETEDINGSTSKDAYSIVYIRGKIDLKKFMNLKNK